ncbi:MAG: hypothetical protein NW241_07170 [Bacteroidia bacterium]|nr:hypothetical protein [Bacteroidia bacterium]
MSYCASLALVFQPLRFAQACAWDPDEYFYGYSFFDPALSGQADFSPFFASYQEYYPSRWFDDHSWPQANAELWRQASGNQAAVEDIQALFLDTDETRMREIRNWVVSGKAVEETWRSNTFVQWMKTSKATETADYLLFAKRCEPQVTYSFNYETWEEEPKDLALMERLLGEAQTAYSKTRNPGIKLRYAYQAVRLAHYAGKFREAVSLYDQLVEPLKAQNAVAQRALGHKAGALMGLGQTTEALYLFSRLFDEAPFMRLEMYQSFQVESDEKWLSLMKRCRTPDEQVTLHLIRGIDMYSRAIEELRDMYALNPASPKINLLLAREINKLEYDLMGWEFDFRFPFRQEYDGVSKEEALAYLEELDVFVKRCNQEKKTAVPGFWALAEGYLAFLRSDFDRAATLYAGVRDPKLQARVRLLQWVNDLSRIQSLTPELEDQLYRTYQSFSFDPDEHELTDKAGRYLRHTFSRLYTEAGQTAQAFLCLNSYETLQYNPSAELVDEILAWLNQVESRKPNAFETYLLSQLGEHPRYYLQEMKATLLLRKGEWQQAIGLYEAIPMQVLGTIPTFSLPADPFESYNSDCIHCFESGDNDPYSRMTFARRMQELEAQAARPAASAQTFLTLGNAVYNTSFFGPAWMATGYTRSSSLWYGMMPDYGSDYYAEAVAGLREQNSRAESWYRKAIAAAGRDSELAARATFMAAKCRQNAFYLDGYDDYDHLDQKRAYRKDFDALIRKYKNTRYYQEIIQECGYLITYSYN